MTPAPLLRTPALSALPHVAHGFSTRAGGVTPGSLGSLNLARRPGETDARLVENWRRACAAVRGAPDDLALLSQVHGAAVLRVERPSGPLATLGEADGAVTTVPGVVLAVRTADCVPVLFAAPGGVAVAHAGWRGTAAGVVAATLAALTAASGCAASDVTAAIGPCISGAAYEVGPEVVAGLRDAGLPDEAFLHPSPGPRAHVDLGRAVAAQLAALGVAQVDRLARCTLRDDALHSHRRDGAASGRLAGLIRLSG